MIQIVHILEIALPLLYIVVFGLYLRQFLRTNDTAPGFSGSNLLYGTLASHVVYLMMRGIAFHHFPVSSRAEFLSLLALCVGLVYAFAETRQKEADTGIFFIGITVAFQVFSSILIDDITPHKLLHENPVYGIHVIFTVFGFAALAVSALYALMYVMLSRQLKSRNLGVIFKRMPPLSSLENMSRLATVSGVALLFVGIVLGHAVSLIQLNTFNFSDPKVLITDLAWLVYASALIIAKTRSISGLRMAYLSLFGYLFFIASIVIANTFSSSFHSFQ